MVNSWLRTSKVLMMALLVVAVSASMARPVQAQAPPVPAGHVYNAQSPRCLDSGIPTDVQMWSCSTAIYQQWFMSTSGQIIGNQPAGCLDGGSGTVGGLVPMLPCTGAASQKWFWDWNYGHGSDRIYNLANGLCLEVSLANINHNGSTVQLGTCGSGLNQQWMFESLINYSH